jgi:hypothetical protein
MMRAQVAEMTEEPNTFYVPGDRLLIRRGFPMEWRTRMLEAEDKR